MVGLKTLQYIMLQLGLGIEASQAKYNPNLQEPSENRVHA